MTIRAAIDWGTGPSLLLVPGIQGRCEWLHPVATVLSQHFRVISFSLDEIPRDRFFDRAVESIDEVLHNARVGSTIVVGYSFGGLVALRYAARRRERVSHLVLASAPAPSWRIDPRSADYVKRPRLSLPFFAMRGAARLTPEIMAALPTWGARGHFASGFGLRALRWPASPSHMATWARTWMETDLAPDARRIVAPTLVITGDEHLDRVVPVSSSREYLRLIPHARHISLPGTGHLGPLLHPRAFAEIVGAFAGDSVPRDGASSLGRTATAIMPLGR